MEIDLGYPTKVDLTKIIEKLLFKGNDKEKLRRSQGLWHVFIFLRHCTLKRIPERIVHFESANDLEDACFDLNGVSFPIESKSRNVYFEPFASQGKDVLSLFRHQDGPRQTYLNRMYTGLSGGGPKKPEYFSSTSTTLPVTISLKDNWILELRSKPGNDEILDDLLPSLITYIFRYGVPDNPKPTSLISILKNNDGKLRDNVQPIPQEITKLKTVLENYFGLKETELEALFPKINALKIENYIGGTPLEINDIKNIILDNFSKQSFSLEQTAILSNKPNSTINWTELGTIPEIYDVPLNLLLKGVPGTGKSYLIESIIKKNLELELSSSNVKRISIHSGSENSSLMQGVGIGLTNDSQIIYREKKGEILSHVQHAVCAPNQPFVLILEEVQENSLNELIGDLIFLIETARRVDVRAFQFELESANLTGDSSELINWINDNYEVDSILLPSLVENCDASRLILPRNLYLFCTSNFRDDKKIMEDNLLRRFDVIDLFPKTSKEQPGIFYSEEISLFLESLNEAVLLNLKETELHPDRFIIGHARFIKDIVYDKVTFMRAFKKLIDEFKEIRDLDYEVVKSILSSTAMPVVSGDFLNAEEGDFLKSCNNYFEIIKFLQSKCGYAFDI